MNISQIAEGWFNSFLDTMNLLDQETKSLGISRMNICSSCPVRTKDTCDSNKQHTNIHGYPFNGCACKLSKKTVCTTCRCPGGFW